MQLLSIQGEDWSRGGSPAITAASMRWHQRQAVCFRVLGLGMRQHQFSKQTMRILCIPTAPFYKHSGTAQLGLLLSTIQPLLPFTALHLPTLHAAFPVIFLLISGQLFLLNLAAKPPSLAGDMTAIFTAAEGDATTSASFAAGGGAVCPDTRLLLSYNYCLLYSKSNMKHL